MVEPGDCRQLFRKLTTCGTVTKEELITSGRLAHALLQHLDHSWASAVTANKDNIMVAIYMADGWSSFIRKTNSAKVGQNNVTIRGKSRYEFLLERAVLHVKQEDFNPVGRKLMKFGPPVSLKHGKKALNIFTAMSEFSPLLRSFGHTGIAISVYLFDGGLVSPMQRHCQAWHSLYYKFAGDLGELPELLMATDLGICLKMRRTRRFS